MKSRQLWTVVVAIGFLLLTLTLQRYVMSSNPVLGRQPQPDPVPLQVNASLPPMRHNRAIPIPQVDAASLMAHIEALAGERYGEADRQQARQYIQQSLEKFGWQPTRQSFQQGINIVAERTGTDPTAGTIVVAAHYDTVPDSPGADDNASGVATVLEVARLLGPQPTPRTLKVALFDKEETGLHGSRAFTAQDRQIAPLKGAIVLDMVGYACQRRGCQKLPEGVPANFLNDRGDFIAGIVDQEHASLLRAFQVTPLKSLNGPMGLKSTFQKAQKDFPALATIEIPLKGLLVPDLLRSDHAPFWYRGVGAILFTDTANFRSPYYHRPSDKPGTIDRTFLTQVAQLIVTGTTNLLNLKD